MYWLLATACDRQQRCAVTSAQLVSCCIVYDVHASRMDGKE